MLEIDHKLVKTIAYSNLFFQNIAQIGSCIQGFQKNIQNIFYYNSLMKNVASSIFPSEISSLNTSSRSNGRGFSALSFSFGNNNICIIKNSIFYDNYASSMGIY